MFDSHSFLTGFVVILSVAFFTWCLSLVKRDVSIVDSLWPLLFLAAAATYAATVPKPGPRTALVLVLVGLWALRRCANCLMAVSLDYAVDLICCSVSSMLPVFLFGNFS